MLKTFKEKSAVLADKVVTARNMVAVTIICAVQSAQAQAAGGATATQSATKLSATLSAFLGLMPIASKIAGLIVMIGGLWSMYKYYKSQGRDGSIAAGIAGIGIGVGLFFLSGLLNLGADSLGIDKNTAMPV